MTGYSREEAMVGSSIGLNLWVDESARASVVALLRAGRPVVGAQQLFRTKSGTIIKGLFSAQMLQLNDEPYILSSIDDVTERSRLEDERRTTAQRLDTLLSSLHAGVLSVSEDGRVELVNQAFCDFFDLTEPPASFVGLSSKEMVGKIRDRYATPAETLLRIQTVTAQGKAVHGEEVHLRNGRVLVVDFVPVLVDGKPCGRIWHHQDITERYRAGTELQEAKDLLDTIVENVPLMIFMKEARDLHYVAFNRAGEDLLECDRKDLASQKMEAIGHLAGGVAHDFNNLLSVILSYTEFAMEGVRTGDFVESDLLEVRKAAERAASLTRQLLAFSRKQVLQPVALNLNESAVAIQRMLSRILGEDIELVQRLAPDLGWTKVDPSQIEQVLMNLVVNARDAMPEGGKLTIETANVQVDEEFAARHLSVTPGQYVQIAVTDTGCGMDKEVKARLFEPFFTTKEKGKGTGLGLSTVYGIIKQSGGDIWVYSELGHGTTIRIFLPRDHSMVTTVVAPTAVREPATGTETILLVEDEEALRNVTQRILVEAGYTVLTADGGHEALRVSAQHAGELQLLFTDVVMPKMSGNVLANTLLKARPTLKVLYMSGYTDNAIVHHGVLDAGTNFLPKPFTSTDVTRKVRRVLDEDASALPDRTPPYHSSR